MTEPASLDLNLLRVFSPLDGLKNENLRALARKTTVRDLGQGRLLFKEGDTDKRTFYLVSGTIDLLSEGHLVGSMRAGTPDARQPLAPILPRRCAAAAGCDDADAGGGGPQAACRLARWLSAAHHQALLHLL